MTDIERGCVDFQMICKVHIFTKQKYYLIQLLKSRSSHAKCARSDARSFFWIQSAFIFSYSICILPAPRFFFLLLVVFFLKAV